MGFGRGAAWAVRFKVLVVMVAALAEYGVSGAWGQLPSQAGWLSIDCGSPAEYTDAVTGINWVPDTPYIATGKVVNLTASSAFPESNTLRAFPDAHAKSCYSLPVNPDYPYTLRATFFYAGYDNAPNPPSFDLAVDGTVFDSVTGEVGFGIWREALFVPARNAISFCLVRDAASNTVPFISAISLKPYLGNYRGIDAYLELKLIIGTELRVDFGGNKTLRYPDDPIDRYWFSAAPNTSYLRAAAMPLELISTTEPIANVNKTSNYVPWPVLQTGLQLPTPGNVTLIPLGGVDKILKKAQVCMHFAELDPLATVTSREFTISVPRPDGPFLAVENAFNFTEPPAPFTANTWFSWDLVDVGPTTEISFWSSPTAVRGPIINGLEVFFIVQPDGFVTNTRDVLAIEAIKTDMNLTEWTGDPCVPVPHNWLNCTVNVEMKLHEVTFVDLSGYNLTGPISPSFAKLEVLTALSLANNALTGPVPDLSTLAAVETLQLENNALTGPLPSWLSSLKGLSKLSVENNNFSGEIPPGLVGVNSLQFTYQPGNSDLFVGSATVSNPTSSKTNFGIIIGAVVGGLVGLAALVGLIVGYCVYKSRTKAEKNTKPGGVGHLEIAGANAFSFAQVAACTNNFKRKIGSGGFGPVYYGRLPSGQEVAVKVADSSSLQGAAEFYNEVELMSRVHHRNLVPLVGYCQEGANQILVYEFVDMGSLHDHLFGTSSSSSKSFEALNWNKRLNVAVNAAQGLEYLHMGCIPGIIHRDVKTSNILLTSNSEVAKVADFGLSKLTSDENATHVSTLVKGTAGYLDPEYWQTNCLTFKSDVYSFGVVLLELMTGRPPVSTSLTRKSAGNLVDWVRENLSAGDMDAILDPTLKASNPNLDGLWKVAEVAMNCVEPKGAHRPTMRDVVQELRAALALEPTSHVEYHSEPSSNTVTAFLAESMPSVR